MGVAAGGFEKYGHHLILDEDGFKLMWSQEPHVWLYSSCCILFWTTLDETPSFVTKSCGFSTQMTAKVRVGPLNAVKLRIQGASWTGLFFFPNEEKLPNTSKTSTGWAERKSLGNLFGGPRITSSAGLSGAKQSNKGSAVLKVWF